MIRKIAGSDSDKRHVRFVGAGRILALRTDGQTGFTIGNGHKTLHRLFPAVGRFGQTVAGAAIGHVLNRERRTERQLDHFQRFGDEN